MMTLLSWPIHNVLSGWPIVSTLDIELNMGMTSS